MRLFAGRFLTSDKAKRRLVIAKNAAAKKPLDAVRTAVADVKNVLMSGDFADAKVVKIENLQIVIVNAEPGANVNVNSGVESVQKTDTILQ
jgi:hypothetical protein